jgi:FMN phosphatase YigB (HAD superfamily)
MSLYTRKTESFLQDWYFHEYIPRMCAVLSKYYCVRPGVLELFHKLKNANINYAVYSDYPETQARLNAIGIDSADCGKVYGPESFGAQKPAPRPFITIAQDMGSRPEESLVIGDREDTDGAGARSAGMQFLLIRKRENLFGC